MNLKALLGFVFCQPGEMSLEEIETRIGPLLEPDVITNLKSAVWKERLEGKSLCLRVYALMMTNCTQNVTTLTMTNCTFVSPGVLFV